MLHVSNVGLRCAGGSLRIRGALHGEEVGKVAGVGIGTCTSGWPGRTAWPMGLLLTGCLAFTTLAAAPAHAAPGPHRDTTVHDGPRALTFLRAAPAAGPAGLPHTVDSAAPEGILPGAHAARTPPYRPHTP